MTTDGPPGPALDKTDPSNRGVTSAGAPPQLTAGAQVGRFFLLKLLGEGGMGVVWSAYDPQLDRKVALKFVRTDGGGPEALGRFLREAQALARVSHPNVIAVHDVGTDRHALYIAQEFVKGSDLGDWQSAAPRPLAQLLAVYVQAARGLSAAHAAGIVHRDFKPANVLIGEDGQVKVVDFGLARTTGREDLLQTAPGSALAPAPGLSGPGLTQPGTLMGTPLYMSPEQHQGHPADERSDQFSFCVALYEAVYGARPFSGDTLMALALQVTQGRLQPAPRGAAVPAWLRAVLVRGLQTRVEDRHPSMDALIAALTREPRDGKWWAARAAVAGGGALLLGLGAQQVQVRQQLCQGAEAKLSQVWDGPRRDATHAAFLATGLPFAEQSWSLASQALDAYARDWAAQRTQACEATRRRGEQSEEVLDLRMACLDQRLGELKASTDLLAHADAQAVQKALQLALAPEPLGWCADVEALRAPVRPPRDLATAQQVEAVRAAVARARALESSGRFQEGLRQAESAWTLAQAVAYPPLHAEALAQLGSLQVQVRSDDAAEATLERAWETAERCKDDRGVAQVASLLVAHVGQNRARAVDGHRWARIARAVIERTGNDAARLGQLQCREGVLFDGEGRYGDAVSALQAAVALQTQALGPQHPDLAASEGALGLALGHQGRRAEAMAAHQRALAIREKALGPDHPDAALSHHNIANLLEADGKHDEALALHRRALAIKERALGPRHPDVADSLDSIGVVLEDMARREESLAAFRQALGIREAALGPGHPQVADSHSNLGTVLEQMGRYDEALREDRLGLALRERALGPSHPDVASSHNNLSVVLSDQGRLEESLAEGRQALVIWEQLLGPEHPDVAIGHNNLSSTLQALHRVDEAMAEGRLALAIREKALGPDHPSVAGSHSNLADLLLDQGKLPEALAEIERALALLTRVLGPGDPLVAESELTRGRILLRQGKGDDALAAIRQALAIDEKALGPAHADTALIRGGLGQALVAQRQWREAKAVLDRALADQAAAGTPAEPQAESQFALAQARWALGDRAGATALAQAARTSLNAHPTARELPRVEAWLAAHAR
jgi:serine/threonine-protein kinase